MNETVYLNGSFVPQTEAVVSAFDGGYLHGAGLFETMRAENGRVFRLVSHLQRLQTSTTQLLRPLKRSELPSERDFCELLERNRLPAARVRLTVSAGSMIERPHDDGQCLTVCATATRLEPPPARLYEMGVSVAVCKFKQSRTDPIAGHKTTAYLPRLLALRQASHAGCTEALWFTEKNELAEGSISNVFVVSDGVLKTPPLSTPVLPGIARGVLLAIAQDSGIEAREVAVTIDELLDADEVLLTNAIMQVLPVIRVETRDIGNGRVGPVAKRMLDEYQSLVRMECGTE